MSASDVSELWGRIVSSSLVDSRDTLFKLGSGKGTFSMLGEGSGSATFISIPAESLWVRLTSLDVVRDNEICWFDTL